MQATAASQSSASPPGGGRLVVTDLRKRYNGTPALDGVSFTVDAGEVLGLLGPNGAGKTTCMTIIAGLLEPDGGAIALDGLAGADRRRVMGIVPQDLAIYGDLTARENLWFFGGLYGLRGQALQGRIDAVLDLVALRQHAGQMIRTFSGGMRRRLNLAIGLLHQPKLLILDEPTVGVDPQSRSHVLRRVRELADGGMAVLYASHYMEEVQAICDRAVILDHGRVLAEGRLETLLSRVHGVTTLRVAGPDEAALRGALAPMAGVEPGPEGVLRVVAGGAHDAGGDLGELLERLVAAVRRCGGRVLSVEAQESNLEQLFLELTGRHLRD